jgi:CheY-like chemotaxis protein
MNSLLIYNDSITSETFVNEFKESLFGDSFSFRISNTTLNKEDFSFDKEATDFLLNTIPNKEYLAVFLPFNLSDENYLEFTGLKLGYHIRLTKQFLNSKVALIFYGAETSHQINKLTPNGEILFTPNVYITNKQNIDSFKKQIKFIEENKDNASLEKKFISKIHIKPTGNYSSHHSISNEWSILRWSKALNVVSNEIDEIENKIGYLLYYKYLNFKFPLDSSSHIKLTNKILSNSGNILFIDDEVEKGWNIIFKTICKNKTYNSIGGDFKNWNQMEIIEESFKKAKDADVVILDLRLHDDDFESTSPKELTGFKILDKIKSHNRGIQVIIFSATNKIWNLQALREAGADGFIIKESPENSVDKSFTNQSIENIFKTIDKSLEFSFLIDYYDVYNDLETSLKSKIKSKELDKDFVNEYLKWLSFGINNLTIYKNSEGIVTSFLMFFSVLENLCNRIIDIDNYERDYHNSENVFKFKFRHNNTYLIHFNCMDDDYTKTNNTLYSKNSRLNWGQKILNTLNFLSNYKIEDDLNGINKLIKKRNDLIHSNVTTGDKINISVNDVNNLFNLITTNIDKIK